MAPVIATFFDAGIDTVCIWSSQERSFSFSFLLYTNAQMIMMQQTTANRKMMNTYAPTGVPDDVVSGSYTFGLLVGALVVGEVLGLAVDGLLVAIGLDEGTFVGLLVGLLVGLTVVGLEEGTFVGFVVGLDEGILVGSIVGSDVGSSV